MNQQLPREKARSLVKDAILSCLLSAEADGFQEHETTEWSNKIENIEYTDKYIYITLDGLRFRIEITKER